MKRVGRRMKYLKAPRDFGRMIRGLSLPVTTVLRTCGYLELCPSLSSTVKEEFGRGRL